MRIEDITKIIDGKLQNFPSVDHVNAFRINPDNIAQGDLFLDANNSVYNQKTAIKNGAYAIVSENILSVLDNEIAWIEVDSLRLACIKLSRYEFSKKNSSLLFLNDIAEEMLHSIIKYKTYEKLPSNTYKALLLLTKNGENIQYTCSDERLAHSIDPVCDKIKEHASIQYLQSKSPFYSSFIYKDVFYKNLKIPSIFIEYFCEILEFVAEKKLHHDAHSVIMSEHFVSVFIDNKLHKKDFGQTTKAVIFEKNIDYLDMEFKYLERFTEDLVLCVPKRYANYFKTCTHACLFKDKQELATKLKENFRYALVFGDIKEYHDIFSQPKIEHRGLFS
ncbi:hypothetical protein [Sulfurospirillum sp. 1612]|uniref:hypothetical protein n=1 Tax=Sulfurospirillum sp. 1612 TaxID=3094835 RepID=UPI002F955975